MVQANVSHCLCLALGNLFGAIHRLWLPLVGLGVCAKGQAVYQGWLPPALSPGAGQQKVQDPPDLLCLPPPAGCLLGSVSERASGGTRVA